MSNTISVLYFYLAANVQGLVSKGKLTTDKAEKALSMLKGVLDYSNFKDVDMVIEVSSKYPHCCRLKMILKDTLLPFFKMGTWITYYLIY